MFRRAEEQLNREGLAFLKIDRSQITAKGWDVQSGKVKAVYVNLKPIDKRRLTIAGLDTLKKLGNWEEIPEPKEGRGAERGEYWIYSRLQFKETRGRKKKDVG